MWSFNFPSHLTFYTSIDPDYWILIIGIFGLLIESKLIRSTLFNIYILINELSASYNLDLFKKELVSVSYILILLILRSIYNYNGFSGVKISNKQFGSWQLFYTINILENDIYNP